MSYTVDVVAQTLGLVYDFFEANFEKMQTNFIHKISSFNSSLAWHAHLLSVFWFLSRLWKR
ncbi:hypothetical protein NUK55_21550 [Aeromonas veronii]|uniref:hypothetical protein n=1 Tax=Aeromonas veronii TaxID=654 RepID=UPI00214DB94B|nr:hypothetical protein [Aeromonas veronii]MCR3973655.1 hypothetical protein [Aeromonas veronii]MCR3977864.1 hypothetical protein [Aeromonas veronii]